MSPRVFVWLVASISVGIVGPACGGHCDGRSSGITSCQINAHAEASLLYPGVSTVSNKVVGEDDGNSGFEHTDPVPAHSEIVFTTTDKPDKVMAWYDEWLKSRSWEESGLNGEGRYWQRGDNEQISLYVPLYLQQKSQPIKYDYTYRLFSSRFPPLSAPASPITDPVRRDAVTTRHVGIINYGFHEVTDGTASADAARQDWSSTGWIDTIVVMAANSSDEQVSPPRAAYELRAMQVPEYYDEPAHKGADPKGHLLQQQQDYMYTEGFTLVGAGSTTLTGQPAARFTYRRGDREVYELAVAYGPVLTTKFLRTVNNTVNGTWTAPYRVAGISVVHAILPKDCGATETACLSLVPSPDRAIG